MKSPDEVLKIFLETSRDLIREPSLEKKLRLVARGLVDSGMFGRSAVQLYTSSYGEKIFGAAGLTPEEEEWLFEHDTLERADYERILHQATDLGGMYYIPHYALSDHYVNQVLLASKQWPPPGGNWHPDDMFYVPLNSSDGITMGNITADEPPDGRIPDLEVARLMAPFVALAEATVEQELARRHDYLTGLLNGNFFYDIIHRRIAAEEPFGLAYCDMDGLKQINDSLGHEAGDRAIRQFADKLKTMVESMRPRRKIMAFRLHGDEFAILFDLNNWDRTDPLPDHCLDSVKCFEVSFGIAVSEPGDSVSTLMRRAELNMYRDKDGKRLTR